MGCPMGGPAMQLFVRTLSSDAPTLVLNVKDAQRESIATVKARIEELEGIPAEEQRLYHGGKLLGAGANGESMSLAECGVGELATLHLSLALLGGGKKRKKKTFTGPKKQKHVRKKQKLGVLKLYKIGDNNEIERQRMECPSPSCGAGIFMAKHKNRLYCGKCHNTLIEKSGGGGGGGGKGKGGKGGK